MKLKREVKDGVEVVPRFYGVAWREPERRVYVCYPIPLNLIMGLAFNLWLLAMSNRPGWMQKKFDAVYRRGWDDGHKVGRLLGHSEGRGEISRVVHDQTWRAYR